MADEIVTKENENETLTELKNSYKQLQQELTTLKEMINKTNQIYEQTIKKENEKELTIEDYLAFLSKEIK